MPIYHHGVNHFGYPLRDLNAASLVWRDRDVAVLRIKKKHGWKPLLALAVFLTGWYGALMTTIDFDAVSPAWLAVWRTLKSEPPLLVVFLIPLFPVIMITRDILMENRLLLHRGERAIYKRKKRIMVFDDVSALLIRQRPKKSMRVRAGADLSLGVRGGGKIFLARCPSYESCSVLAHEIATVVGAPVKSG